MDCTLSVAGLCIWLDDIVAPAIENGSSAVNPGAEPWRITVGDSAMARLKGVANSGDLLKAGTSMRAIRGGTYLPATLVDDDWARVAPVVARLPSIPLEAGSEGVHRFVHLADEIHLERRRRRVSRPTIRASDAHKSHICGREKT